jgi:hypothetical protein
MLNNKYSLKRYYKHYKCIFLKCFNTRLYNNYTYYYKRLVLS